MICARDVNGVERMGKLHTRLSPRASQFATRRKRRKKPHHVDRNNRQWAMIGSDWQRLFGCEIDSRPHRIISDAAPGPRTRGKIDVNPAWLHAGETVVAGVFEIGA